MGDIDWSAARERAAAVELAKRAAYWGEAPGRRPVFAPALTDEQIADVEAGCGVTLPESYRNFLAQVGSGGPGPGLRLSTLSRRDETWAWDWHVPDLSIAFVETQQWPDRQRTILRAAGHEPTVQDEYDDYIEDFRAAFGDEGGERVWGEERDRGATLISDHGCGHTSWLILVGPHYGELRFRECGLNTPYDPQFDAQGDPHTFGSWYMQWLESEEREWRP